MQIHIVKWGLCRLCVYIIKQNGCTAALPCMCVCAEDKSALSKQVSEAGYADDETDHGGVWCSEKKRQFPVLPPALDWASVTLVTPPFLPDWVLGRPLQEACQLSGNSYSVAAGGSLKGLNSLGCCHTSTCDDMCHQSSTSYWKGLLSCDFSPAA